MEVEAEAVSASRWTCSAVSSKSADATIDSTVAGRVAPESRDHHRAGGQQPGEDRLLRRRAPTSLPTSANCAKWSPPDGLARPRPGGDHGRKAMPSSVQRCSTSASSRKRGRTRSGRTPPAIARPPQQVQGQVQLRPPRHRAQAHHPDQAFVSPGSQGAHLLRVGQRPGHGGGADRADSLGTPRASRLASQAARRAAGRESRPTPPPAHGRIPGPWS
jgi:hypothetical protein